MTTKREYLDLLFRSADDGTFPSTANGTCLYRGPNGKKCAVGVLIPDDKYEELMDSRMQTVDVIERAGVAVEGMGIEDFCSVQRTHDSEARIETWNVAAFKRRLLALPCFADLAPEYAARV